MVYNRDSWLVTRDSILWLESRDKWLDRRSGVISGWWIVAQDFAVHEDSGVFAVRHPYGAFGVEGVFAFGPA